MKISLNTSLLGYFFLCVNYYFHMHRNNAKFHTPCEIEKNTHTSVLKVSDSDGVD